MGIVPYRRRTEIRGKIIVTYTDMVGPSILPKVGQYVTLDPVTISNFKKIFCSCGRIVDLDKNEVLVKERLGKDIECIRCRNTRISAEIDSLDAHFEVSEAENTQ